MGICNILGSIRIFLRLRTSRSRRIQDVGHMWAFPATFQLVWEGRQASEPGQSTGYKAGRLPPITKNLSHLSRVLLISASLPAGCLSLWEVRSLPSGTIRNPWSGDLWIRFFDPILAPSQHWLLPQEIWPSVYHHSTWLLQGSFVVSWFRVNRIGGSLEKLSNC